MTKKAEDSGAPQRHLMVTRVNDERLRLTFPDNWKVTLSHGINPAQNGYMDGQRGCVLRLYSPGPNQRALLIGVKECFDMDVLTIERQKSTVRMQPPAEGRVGRIENIPVHEYAQEWEPYLPDVTAPEETQRMQVRFGRPGGLAELVRAVPVAPWRGIVGVAMDDAPEPEHEDPGTHNEHPF